ncbi:MAG: menaquinone biosynthesis protein [Flavipsychrobacter sp.]|nr:menaquinone biosynthesis protein [Flavipsychrobacter sp.]
MDRKIRVGAVQYLNTKPLIYGLQQGMMKEELELVMDYPANVAKMLIEDQVDIGLVPVATIPKLNEYHIVCDYGIACDGEVASVGLFSDVPMEEITTVLLDYQSRTSVRLARILMKEFWKIDPEIIDTRDDFRGQIKGTTAGIVIGDRALEQRKDSAYVFDLGQAWKEMTGLPFVFAAWIANKKIEPGFIKGFNEANRYGLERLKEVVEKYPYKTYDLFTYYKENIDYKLDARKMEGLELYLKYLRQFGL